MMRRAIVLGFPLLAAAIAGAQDGSIALRPGVVIDRASAWVYSMKPGGGLEAIDARSGRVLFESKLADKPIALWDGMLVAQRESKSKPGVLEVVLIDTARPDRTSSIDVALPADELARVDDGLGRTFTTNSVVRDGELLVGWNAARHWVSPLPPEPGENLHEEKVGAVRLDLTDGRAYPVDLSRLDDAPLPEDASRIAALSDLFGKTVRVGQLIASTETTAGSSGASHVVLKRWRQDGSALPDIELFRGEPIVQWPSADGRHLLISERVAPGEVDEYLWHIFSLESGTRVGQIRKHDSQAWFYLDGGRMIHDVWPWSHRVDGKIMVVPRMIQAVDIASGKVLWQRPLRETRYLGRYPS